MRAPLNTSTLGPIKVDPAARAARARVVREALEQLHHGATDENVATGLHLVIVHASDETLVALGRLLK
jgi:hypothetical protein